MSFLLKKCAITAKCTASGWFGSVAVFCRTERQPERQTKVKIVRHARVGNCGAREHITRHTTTKHSFAFSRSFSFLYRLWLFEHFFDRFYTIFYVISVIIFYAWNWIWCFKYKSINGYEKLNYYSPRHNSAASATPIFPALFRFFQSETDLKHTHIHT